MDKSRVSTSVASSPVKKEDPAFPDHMYLKPGALARIRDSKITAKSKGASSHDSLGDLKIISSSSTDIINQTQMTQMPIEGVPSFPSSRIRQFSSSGARKKLFAAAPTFSDT